MSKKVKVARPDRCSCGNPLAFEVGTSGVYYWCWLCDGHASDCKQKQHPWGNCRCVPDVARAARLINKELK